MPRRESRATERGTPPSREAVFGTLARLGATLAAAPALGSGLMVQYVDAGGHGHGYAEEGRRTRYITPEHVAPERRPADHDVLEGRHRARSRDAIALCEAVHPDSGDEPAEDHATERAPGGPCPAA